MIKFLWDWATGQQYQQINTTPHKTLLDRNQEVYVQVLNGYSDMHGNVLNQTLNGLTSAESFDADRHV